MPKTKRYKTPKQEPKCVKYWDKQYLGSEFWFDWLMVKNTATHFIPEIMEELDCSIKEAQEVVWTAYIEASCGDEESPMFDAFSELACGLSDYSFALYTMHLTIGSDIHDGFSKSEAKDNYREWLEDDAENRLFGDWMITNKLKIIPSAKRKKKGKRKKG